MTTDPPSPRRAWHLQRWLLLLATGFLAYGGWTQYAFRAALKEAKALGWIVKYTDPIEEIRLNWKAAFEKEAWLNGVTDLDIPTGLEFEQHLAVVHRLNPSVLAIGDATNLSDLSGLKALTRLQFVYLNGCKRLTNVDALKNLSALHSVYLSGSTRLTNVDALKGLSALQYVNLFGSTRLTNVDALKNLSALQDVRLIDCTGLTNVDALKSLPALQRVSLDGCTGLTPESVEALKAALPNTRIDDP